MLTGGGLYIVSPNMQCLYRQEDSKRELKKYTEQTGFDVKPLFMCLMGG